jgi:hypothetical protein
MWELCCYVYNELWEVAPPVYWRLTLSVQVLDMCRNYLQLYGARSFLKGWSLKKLPAFYGT